LDRICQVYKFDKIDILHHTSFSLFTILFTAQSQFKERGDEMDKDKKNSVFFRELEIGEKFIAVSPFAVSSFPRTFLGKNPEKEATLLNPGLIYDVFVKIPDIPGILGTSKNCLKLVTGETHYISPDAVVIRVRC